MKITSEKLSRRWKEGSPATVGSVCGGILGCVVNNDGGVLMMI